MAAYQKTAAGLGGYHATITIKNVGNEPVDVADMKAEFVAIRDGVRFVCREHVGGQTHAREPRRLLPNETYAFARDIDCDTTLVGRYDVSANVAFGKGPAEFAGTFALDIVGGGNAAPRPYPGRPAIHVALTGETLVRSMPQSAWRQGEFAPVVVVTNSGSSPVKLGAMRVVLRMRNPRGALVPCESEAWAAPASSGPKSYALDVWKDAPFVLEPGRSQYVSIPVRCAPRTEGEYRVEGYVVLGDGPIDDGCPVGPLLVKVTSDPALTVPQLTIPGDDEDERRRISR